MLHANLGLPRPPPRNFQPPLPQQPPKQTQQRRHNVPPAVASRQRSRNADGMRRLANNIVIPEFSAWLTLVLEQCRAENIRNLPRQRAPTPLFPETPGGMLHANLGLPTSSFRNFPSRNNLQNCAATASRQRSRNADVAGTFVLERCRAENIRNLPRKRAPTPLCRPREHAPCQSRAPRATFSGLPRPYRFQNAANPGNFPRG